jgi:transposase-like protein
MAEPTINLSTIAKHFSDEAEAYRLIESIRWPDGPVCPHCGTVDHAYVLEPRKGQRTTRKGTISHRRIWKCGACRKQFSVLVGTIFEDSKVPLSKWLLTIHLLCAGKNGVSAHELHRQLGVTYRTAWFMAHRVRYAMERPAMGGKLAGIIEADETYIGGKAKNMHRSKRESAGALAKVPVVTLVERDGEARSKVMDRVTSETIARCCTSTSRRTRG